MVDNWRERLLLDIEAWDQSDSDEEIERAFLELVTPPAKTRGGSVVGRSANLERDRLSGHERIMSDYFVPRPRAGVRVLPGNPASGRVRAGYR